MKTSRVRIDARDAGARRRHVHQSEQRPAGDAARSSAARAARDGRSRRRRTRGRSIVVVNHLRSFIDIELVGGEGRACAPSARRRRNRSPACCRSCRRTTPASPVISIGDYNAYQFNDGYTDPIAMLKGTPTPDDQIVVDESPDLVDPNFVNLTDTLPADRAIQLHLRGHAAGARPRAGQHGRRSATSSATRSRAATRTSRRCRRCSPATRRGRSALGSRHAGGVLPLPAAGGRPARDGGGRPPDTWPPGSRSRSRYTVTNTGPSPAQNVVVTNRCRPDLAFVSCAATGGGVCGVDRRAPRRRRSRSLAPGAVAGDDDRRRHGAAPCPNGGDARRTRRDSSSATPPIPNAANNARERDATARIRSPTITGAVGEPARAAAAAPSDGAGHDQLHRDRRMRRR